MSNADKQADGSTQGSVPAAYAPPTLNSPPSSAQDPIARYLEIIRAEGLSKEQKDWLVMAAQSRFQNRRRMAYLALGALLASLAILLAGAVIDGIWETTIVQRLNDAANLLGITNALLTSIIGAYYGFSSLRPSS